LQGKTFRISAIAVICAFLPYTAQAQQETEKKPVPEPVFSISHDTMDVVRSFPHDQLSIYAAPFHMNRQPKVWRYLVPFAIGAALIAADKQTLANLPRGHGGRSATIANLGLDGTAAAAGAFYFTGIARHNEHERETGLLAAESLLNSIIPHTALSLAFGRRRPYQGVGDELGEGDFFARHSASASFPSGHSMYTWAMASTFADEYRSVPAKLFWYSVATTVTVSRVTGREHFPSDVVVGGAIGYLIAKRIYHAHHHAVSGH
jgi:membrane-associated phospholipid phosphatase